MSEGVIIVTLSDVIATSYPIVVELVLAVFKTLHAETTCRVSLTVSGTVDKERLKVYTV